MNRILGGGKVEDGPLLDFLHFCPVMNGGGSEDSELDSWALGPCSIPHAI